MFMNFIVATLLILGVGPLHNEKGSVAVHEKGAKQAVEDGLKNVDADLMKQEAYKARMND